MSVTCQPSPPAGGEVWRLKEFQVSTSWLCWEGCPRQRGRLAGLGTVPGVSEDLQCGWSRMHERTTGVPRSERRGGALSDVTGQARVSRVLAPIPLSSPFCRKYQVQIWFLPCLFYKDTC